MKYIKICICILFMQGFISSAFCQQLRVLYLEPNDVAVNFQEGKSNIALVKQLGLSDDFVFDYINKNNNTYKDNLGLVHERYSQYYKGIRIENSDVRIHYKNKNFYYANGEYVFFEKMDTTVVISRDQAYDFAKIFIFKRDGLDTSSLFSMYKDSEIVICRNQYDSHDTLLHLAYKIDIYSTIKIFHESISVDAKTGKILNSETLIFFDNGTADTRYSGTRTISTKRIGTQYVLRDTTRGSGIETYNMNKEIYSNIASAVDFFDNDNNWTLAEYHNSNKDDGALDAHWGAMMTYDYFKQIHGRDSYDDNNSAIKNYVHCRETTGVDWQNAGWWGASNVMIYGDGLTIDILTALDVIGHEIGHGVCQYSASLNYAGESGAINESLSDIWGASIEKWATSGKQTWLMGEDIGTPTRSISNPKLFYNPDTYAGNYWINTQDVSRNNDFGGVHSNSGVMNYWFYLLSEGGSGANDNGWYYSVNGISMDTAAKIVYRAENNYLTSNTDFCEG